MVFPGTPTYEVGTNTYTSPAGEKQSMSFGEALKTGAVIIGGGVAAPPPTPKPTAIKEPIDPRTGKPYGTVSPYERPVEGRAAETLRLAKISDRLRRHRRLLRAKEMRKRISPREKALFYGLTAASTTIDYAKGIVDIPESVYRVAKSPKILKELPSAIDKAGKDFGYLIRVSPNEALVKVGTEVLLISGSGAALSKASKVTSSTFAKLNPKYVGKAKIGKTFKIKTAPGKTVKVQVVGKIPKQTLKEQVKIAGKKVPVAISSQADELLGVLKRQKIVRKPIPGEKGFSRTTKSLLKKFDDGTITKSEIIKLESAIKGEGAKGLLERAFFLDPTGKIRPSRLGTLRERSANLLDYLSEDITLKKAKPQILLFEDISVKKFPRALKKVGNKLKKGTALTKTEADDLLTWQIKKSGKAKPIGFVTGESEILVSPGELIKRVKKVGVTVVNGRAVPIIKTVIYKPSIKIKKLITKFKKGKLTKTQARNLDKLLKKKTGFDYGLSSSKKIAAKYIDVKKFGASLLSKLKKKPRITKVKRISPKKKPISKVKPKPYRPRKPKYPIKYRPRYKPKYPPKRPPKYPPKRPPKPSPRPSPKPSPKPRPKKYYKPRPRPKPSPKKVIKEVTIIKKVKVPPKPIKGIPIKKKVRVPKKIKKPKEGFLIYEKRGKKFVKLKGRPLTKKEAKDRLAYRLDNKISRSARLVRIKDVRKFGKLLKKERGYFKKYKKNLRNYRIVKGKRVKTPNLYIEKKGRGVISTPGEKRQLALNRMLKARRKLKKRKRLKGGKKKR